VHKPETLRYQATNGVARITLARPDKRNAINAQMFAELGDAAELAGGDPEVRALLLTGEGQSFCAGIDLTALGDLAGIKEPELRSFVRVAQRPYLAIARMEKPTVAAVQGHALGAGFQLALACDLRVAAPDASFAMLEARYGLIPDLGGAYQLARIIGPARAKELVWTARRVEAEEALDIGLVNRVARDGDLDGEANRLLQELLAHSSVPQVLSKPLMDGASQTPLEIELEREADAQSACIRAWGHSENV
jgi:enoyl-CoA hydratase/carnithine racemase